MKYLHILSLFLLLGCVTNRDISTPTSNVDCTKYEKYIGWEMTLTYWHTEGGGHFQRGVIDSTKIDTIREVFYNEDLEEGQWYSNSDEFRCTFRGDKFQYFAGDNTSTRKTYLRVNRTLDYNYPLFASIRHDFNDTFRLDTLLIKDIKEHKTGNDFAPHFISALSVESYIASGWWFENKAEIITTGEQSYLDWKKWQLGKALDDKGFVLEERLRELIRQGIDYNDKFINLMFTDFRMFVEDDGRINTSEFKPTDDESLISFHENIKEKIIEHINRI